MERGVPSYALAALLTWAGLAAAASGADFTPADVEWKPFAIRNNWQHTNHLAGGDGKQYVMDADWNSGNPKVLYLVTDTTRIWKSNDRGRSWRQVGTDLRVLGGICVVSDPGNEDVVYLAGYPEDTVTGDSDGLYQSLDGGVSWSNVAGDLTDFPHKKGGKVILVDPATFDPTLDPPRCRHVYVGTTNGVLDSTDGGLSWSNRATLAGVTYTGLVDDLEWSEVDPDQIYLASDSGLLSMNSGDRVVTQLAASGLPDPPAPGTYDRWDLCVSAAPTNGHDVIYAATTNGVYKSVDGGASFVRKSSGLPGDDYPACRSFCRIACSRENPDRLLTSPGWWYGPTCRGPFWSHDGGETWNYAVEPASETNLMTAEILERTWTFHTKPVLFDPQNPDVALTFLQTPAKSYDGGRSWHFSGNGQIGGRVAEVRFFPADSNRMMISMLDFGVGWSDDGGARFEKKYGVQCSSADLREERFVTASESGSYSLNVYTNVFPVSRQSFGSGMIYGGTKVLTVNSEIEFVRWHPSNSNVVYAAPMYSSGRVSFDGGTTWKTMGTNYGSGVALRAIDPANPDVVYGATKWAAGTFFFRSTNNGLHFSFLGSSPNTNLKENVWAMDVDPFSPPDARRLVAGMGRYMVRYDNGVWTVRTNAGDGLALESDERMRFVRYDPVRSNIVWAGVEGASRHGSGVFLSMDGGLHWTNVNHNLGRYEQIYNLDVSPFDGTVYLTGAGLYTFSIADVTNGIAQQPRPLRDSDDDGIPDGWELQHFGGVTNAGAESDEDADGLDNLGEYLAGTDPQNGDSDSDELPDGWEVLHFGDNSQTATLDPDGDGYNNLAEHIWGTAPTSAASWPAFDSEYEASVELRWWSSTGRLYSVWYTDQLTNGAPWAPLAPFTNLPGTDGTISVTDAVAGVERRFYRARAALSGD